VHSARRRNVWRSWRPYLTGTYSQRPVADPLDIAPTPGMLAAYRSSYTGLGKSAATWRAINGRGSQHIERCAHGGGQDAGGEGSRADSTGLWAVVPAPPSSSAWCDKRVPSQVGPDARTGTPGEAPRADFRRRSTDRSRVRVYHGDDGVLTPD